MFVVFEMCRNFTFTQTGLTGIEEYMVYEDALGAGFSKIKDMLHRHHPCRDSYAMLSLNTFPMCSFLHRLVFGAVNTATVPMRAAVRNHVAKVRMTTEYCFAGKDFAPPGRLTVHPQIPIL